MGFKLGTNPLEIKDHCRARLGKYLVQAISVLPSINKVIILDMGCGTGVPTIILSKRFKGSIYAVDTNEDAINVLKQKISSSHLIHRIFAIQRSVYDLTFTPNYFDIILAEGLFNIIGFEEGLKLTNRFIKENGYVIVHDECTNQKGKEGIIKKLGFKLIHSFMLDEQVWWNDYYQCLEKKINSLGMNITATLFKNEISEINRFKEQPWLFRSMYYVLIRQPKQPS